MASKFSSCAILFTLLAGNGLAGSVSTVAAQPAERRVVPVIDVPAPLFWDADGEIRRGGQAARIEVDDPGLNAAMSVWYRLAYVDGGTRLRVFEHSAATTLGPESDTVQSEELAWRLANEALGRGGRATSNRLPRWARIRTGNEIGSSAGLMYTLTYIDLLTPGRLVGNLRVAGTGGVGSDGVVTPASGVDAKHAAAMLTRPDVIFTTSPEELTEHVTIVESEHTRIVSPRYTVGEWLNVSGYEQAGRNAARYPGTVAVIVVHDLRQALAWLCGRTSNTVTCAAAHRTATIPIGTP